VPRSWDDDQRRSRRLGRIPHRPADHDNQAGDRPRTRNLRCCDHKVPQRTILKNLAVRQDGET